MEINFTLSKDELIGFQLENYKKTCVYIYMTICFYISAIVIGFCWWLQHDVKTMNTLIYILGVMIIRIIYIRFSYNFEKKLIINKYNISEFEYLFNNISLEAGEEKIMMQTSFGYREISYKSLKNIYLLKDYILLCTRTGQIIYLPKHAFNNTEEQEAYIKTVLEKSLLSPRHKYPFRTEGL